jgi:ADP-heptose:LPS heptosyltransferase
MLKTPILFLIFNRPNQTKLVFEKIREIKPSKLYVAADGPRSNVFEDKFNSKLTRDIVNGIDWPCEVKTLFNEKNLGCGKAVSGAITWFFKNEEEGIILEDDCLPDLSFFGYCEELLERYRNEQKIYLISGVNFQKGNKRGEGSYYFSAIPHIWGWASWRRAWDTYDFETKRLPEFLKKNKLSNYFSDEKIIKHWEDTFQSVHEHKIDTWDHQWSFNMYDHNAVSIIPNKNLISNIGFGFNATHTTNASEYAEHPLQVIEKELVHPNEIKIDHEADHYFYKEVDHFFDHEKNSNPGIGYKIKNLVVSTIENFLQKVYLPKIQSGTSNNVLIVKPDAIGDYLIAADLFNSLPAKGDKNDYYLLANIRLKSLIDRNKPAFFKEVIYYDQSIHKHFKPMYSFYFMLRKYKFKKVINMLYSRTKNTDDVVNFTGAPEKIGFLGDTANISAKEKAETDRIYKQLIDLDPRSGVIHEFERNKLFLQKVFGVEIKANAPKYIPSSVSKTNSIVIAPGSNEEYKIWSPQNFGKVCNALHALYPNSKIKVLCGPGEEAIGRKIREVTAVADVVQIADINILINEIAACKLVIANDSAAIHIAVSMNIPNICIFNGSRYGRFVPYKDIPNSKILMPPYLSEEVQKNIRFFYERKFSFNINDVTVDQVINASKEFLK